MNRPVFFISSTIEDFKDLRSAIKYYLEEQGCTVLASEYNDFDKPVDKSITEACVSALSKSQYYVLLIGGRVGSWYDEETRISITRHEYQQAYKLHLEGKVKLLLFVRNEVWQFRQERKELLKFLSSTELAPNLEKQLERYPSGFITNPIDVIAFIDEVCLLSNGTTPTKYQTGNWVHKFYGFRDVIDVIHTQVFLGERVEHVALKRLLITELKGLLKKSIVKEDNERIISIRNVLKTFSDSLPNEIDIRFGSNITVNSQSWDDLCHNAIHVLKIQYNVLIIQHALQSSAFLKFDIDSGGFKEDLVYDQLAKLYSEILRFNSLNEPKITGIIFKYGKSTRSDLDDSIKFNASELIEFIDLIVSWVNITGQLTFIILLLERKGLYDYQFLHIADIIRKGKMVPDPIITDDDIERWLTARILNIGF